MKRTIMYIFIAIIIVALVFSVGLLKEKDNSDSNLKTIQLNEVTRSVFYAPQYVAIENGYFEEQGLKLEITTGQGADKVMTAILAGQSDIGLCGPEAAIYVYNEGKEDYVEVFAQLTQKDGSLLVSKEKTDNFKWTDLIGKTIIPGRKGGVPLKKNGINPQTDVNLDDSIKFDLMAGAFTGGNAEYVTLFEPTASMTEDAGKGYVVASIGEASGEIPYTAYFAKRSYIKENEDIIQGFTNAVYKGQMWVKEHTAAEIAEVIQNFFPDTKLEMLTRSIQSYMDIDAWNDTPVLKEEAFNRLQTVMKEAGELEKEAPYNQVVNNKYAEETIKNYQK